MSSAPLVGPRGDRPRRRGGPLRCLPDTSGIHPAVFAVRRANARSARPPQSHRPRQDDAGHRHGVQVQRVTPAAAFVPADHRPSTGVEIAATDTVGHAVADQNEGGERDTSLPPIGPRDGRDGARA